MRVLSEVGKAEIPGVGESMRFINSVWRLRDSLVGVLVEEKGAYRFVTFVLLGAGRGEDVVFMAEKDMSVAGTGVWLIRESILEACAVWESRGLSVKWSRARREGCVAKGSWVWLQACRCLIVRWKPS